MTREFHGSGRVNGERKVPCPLIGAAGSQPDPLEGTEDVEAGQLNAVVSVLRSGHFEDPLDMGEVDLAQVALDGFDGPADQAAGDGGGGRGQLRMLLGSGAWGLGAADAAVRISSKLLVSGHCCHIG